MKIIKKVISQIQIKKISKHKKHNLIYQNAKKNNAV